MKDKKNKRSRTRNPSDRHSVREVKEVTMMGESDFWHEPEGERLAGCLGLMILGFILLNIVALSAYYCNRREPVTHENTRHYSAPSIPAPDPVPDIKEDNSRQITDYDPSSLNTMYEDTEDYYEDYYDDLYEYYND